MSRSRHGGHIYTEIYTELADGYAASSASGPPNALYDRPTILRLLGPVQGRRVLELGRAAGHLTRELVRAGAEVIALDKSERMVEHARRLVDGTARVEVADLRHPLPMLDGIETTAQMWRRPVSAVFTPLLHQGLVIDAVHEPEPRFDERAVPDDQMRAALNASPVFLYVRATRPPETTTPPAR